MSIKPKRLSPRQRNLIIKSWSRINKLKLAKDAFIEIFKASDFVRTKFVFGELTLKKIRQDDRFVAHCEQIVTEMMRVFLRKYANMVKGISHQHWQMFIDILMDRIIENGNKQFDTGNEVSRAWKMLGQLVAFHIRLGYDHETLRSERSKRLLPMLPIQQANIDRMQNAKFKRMISREDISLEKFILFSFVG
ncbi:unnamed protein product [Anisakis simplex]|uniref:GLOBIN domain-containing protein n=1 Tax=Anisakis simplex TaxID=6269 RepID=A0A0M3K8S4_ANISI|nr:unnamed protein product [Anisakis simplex]